MKTFKTIVPLLFLFAFHGVQAQILLNHNVGEDLVDSGMISCDEDESWGKVFDLAEFGVTTNEQFIVRSIEVGIHTSYNGANLQYLVYSVNKNFPETEPVLLGYGGYGLLPQIDTPQVIRFDVKEPVVVPAGVERIMIVIAKTVDSYNPNSAEVIIAGTQEDRGESYFIGCRKYYSFVSTNDLEVPVPNANFFIRANGEIFSNYTSGSSTTLNHSVCDDLLKPYVLGCEDGGMSWSRDYKLSDFGIATNEEFIINSGQIGIQGVGQGVTVQFRIYKIDENFPDSFLETDLIGSSQVVPVPYFVSNAQLPKIVHVDFEKPVVVPAGVERILVEVYNGGDYAFPASTAQDSGTSWFRSYAGGCTPFGEFVDIRELGWPDTKLYLNVTGKVRNPSGSFAMNITNLCSEFLTKFSLSNAAAVASVLWNFGDPASGAKNTATELSPFHDFSADGTYTITATVTGNNGTIEVLTETIDVKEPPKAYGINNLEACESTPGAGISSAFDTSGIISQVLRDQTNKVVTYIDGSGTRYDVLPNPFTNTVKHRETITVRVAREEELCCYSETTFELIVNPLPDLTAVEDLFLCGNDDDGFTTFDLTPIEADLTADNTLIDFYFQDGEQIPGSRLNEVTNKVRDRETITVKSTNTLTGCSRETTFLIGVTPPPVANTIEDLTGCDDDNDGISQYFDTSIVEGQVLGDQTGLEVSYFTEAGNPLPNPLPNPYTNTTSHEEVIIARVTNPQTGCFAETSFKLTTSSKPRVTTPPTLYACDSGNGSASFDTATIGEQIVGDQTELLVFYYNENGDALTNFATSPFINTVPFEQQITARIEDPHSTACATEVTFSLKTVTPPAIELEERYEICSLGEILKLTANPAFTSWTWFGPEGEILSKEPRVNIRAAGIYGLSVLEENNGILCESYKEFELVHSEAPAIEEIKFSNFSKDSGVEIHATGDGVFEYSLDGIHFQASNFFPNVAGGTYLVTVRDINGCGQVSQTINLLNYPRFFTPNDDGHNDRWHLKGLSNSQNVRIFIFDRYGKLLKQLTASEEGWDGIYNGTHVPSDDYWFHLVLEDGTQHSGHFSILR